MTEEEKKKKEQDEFDKLFDELFKNDSPKKDVLSEKIEEKKDDIFDNDFLKSLFNDDRKDDQIIPKIPEKEIEIKKEKKEEDNFDWLKDLIDEIDREEQQKKKQDSVPATMPAKPVKPSFTSKLKDKPRPPKPPEHIRMWGLGKKIVKMPEREQSSSQDLKSNNFLKKTLAYLAVFISISIAGMSCYKHFNLMKSTELCSSTDVIMRKSYSGDKILIDTSVVSESGKKVIEQGYIDGQISSFMYHYLKPGETAIDIGAGFGYHTLYLARIVGEEGKVYSFEARKAMYELLDTSVLINRLNNVQTFHALLFSESSKIMVNTHDTTARSNFGVTNIVMQSDNIYSDTNHHEEVYSTTLDSVLNGVKNVSMININANGYELNIILGAKSIIANSPNVKIITSWSKYQMAKYVNVQNVVQNLLNNGFKFWMLKPSNGKLVPFTRVEHIMQVERGRFIIAKTLD